MKRKPYTVQEKEILLQFIAIEKVSNTMATYKKEFKLFAVGEYMSGKTPQEIFIDAGVDINILGREQPYKSLSRWRKIHDIYGPYALLQENVRESFAIRNMSETLEWRIRQRATG